MRADLRQPLMDQHAPDMAQVQMYRPDLEYEPPPQRYYRR